MFLPVILLTFLISGIQSKHQYVTDLIEVDWNITTTDNCDMEWTISQPSRGVYAINGFFDIKKDINTDNAKSSVNIYYSTNGISYVLTPFRFPTMVLTNGLTYIYKPYLMDGFKNCCTNALDFDNEFVSPVTKRRIECENLTFSNDNYPSNLRTGFYKFIGIISGEIQFAINLIIKVDNI